MSQSFPFIGGAYTARSKDLNSQVCQNFYVEVDKTGGKNIVALVGCPGAKEWLAITPGEVRGLKTYGEYLYAVIGNTVYEIDTDKSYSSLGTIGTSTGWVDMTDGLQLGIFDSTGGWYVSDSTLTAISGAPTPSGATSQDGYHIVSKAGTDEFYIPAQDDITTWDATDFATAEGDSDNLVSPVSVQRQLWLIGERTTEIWYNAGTTFPFERNPGGFMRTGCNSKRSIATFQDELMFLDDKNRVVRKQGLQLVPISTYQIDYLLSTLDTSGAVGLMYSQEGHVFYELSVGGETVCYDLTTGFWHIRASGANDGRCRANCALRFNNLVLVGDYENGKIYEYDLDTYQDNGDTKRAIRRCQFVQNNDNFTFFSALRLDMETSNTASNIMMRFSDDGGHTWSNERWKSIGGGYGKRVKWNRLGKSRNRVFEVVISDNVQRNINKAYLDWTGGKT
jgi:hypothetical protein